MQYTKEANMRPLPKRKSKSPVNVAPPVDAKVVGLPPAAQTSGMDAAMDVSVASQPPSRKRWVIAGGVILLLSAAVSAYILFGLNRSTNVAAKRLLTAPVAFERFSETIPVNAVLIPEDTVFLDTVEGGRVTNIHVEDGAVVTAGAPLVTLKNADLELQVIGREAQYTQQLSNLAQSQMAFDQSQLRYDRELMDAQLQIDLTQASLTRRLPIDQTGVSQSEIDRLQAELNHQIATYDLIARAKTRDTANAQSNLLQLRGSVTRMAESVDIIRSSLDRLTLRAPIDGQISAFTLRPGQVIAAGSRVGQVDVAGSFKVRATVNEFYLDRLHPRQTATAQIGGQTHALTVSKIYPTIANRQFELDLLFDGALPQNLRRGQNVRARIFMGDAEETLTIPTGPHEAETGGNWVFVLQSNGESAVRRDIETGRRSSDRIEVLSGLSADETIITSSYDAYGDRDRINLSK
jgi:HlyD family secretion protein